MESQAERILALNHISKNFSGTQALDDVTFELSAGEVHCLVGENGAGKSTLIKILSGAEKPDRGEIILYGQKHDHLDPRESIRLGITTIYQDVDLVNTLSVADNIFLGGELKNKYGFVDSRQQEEAAGTLMDRLNIKIEPHRLVESLSPAQKQTLQIVKALHREARIIIMDEPTASLGQEETVALMALARALAAKGMGIIYISHYLNEVFEVGDRITVLKDGKKISTYPKEACTIDRIVRDMVGREAALFYHKEKAAIGEVALKVENYRRGSIVKNVSFEVRRGEIFGIGGMVGSGRTELANLIFGVDRKEGGQLFLNGARLNIETPRQAIEQGFCMIREDRQEEGLFLIRPVKENIGIVDNEQNGLVLKLKREVKAVSHMADRLRIHLASLDQDVSNLSGGNQQKSVLARWLLTEASVYIFDEPTRGVDIGAKEEIYKLMTELARQGKSIIMISSDMPELLSMSDRIGIMRNGEMVKIIPAEAATEEKLLKEFLGLSTKLSEAEYDQ